MSEDGGRTARWWSQPRVVAKAVLATLLAALAIQGHAAAVPRPADGTLIRVAGQSGVALIVGGSPVPLTDPVAVRAATLGADRVATLTPRDYQRLPTEIADGTFVRAPGGAVWAVYGGGRSALPADEIPLRPAQVLPAEVLALIPVAGGDLTPAGWQTPAS
jgi:hypothetical protein